MKTCACCGDIAADDAETCACCGQASWLASADAPPEGEEKAPPAETERQPEQTGKRRGGR